jgi:hypothetical protein
VNGAVPRGRRGGTRELVEEEDAVAGEADLARTGDAAAADEAGVGDGVVGERKGRRARRARPAGRRPAME